MADDEAAPRRPSQGEPAAVTPELGRGSSSGAEERARSSVDAQGVPAGGGEVQAAARASVEGLPSALPAEVERPPRQSAGSRRSVGSAEREAVSSPASELVRDMADPLLRSASRLSDRRPSGGPSDEAARRPSDLVRDAVAPLERQPLTAAAVASLEDAARAPAADERRRSSGSAHEDAMSVYRIQSSVEYKRDFFKVVSVTTLIAAVMAVITVMSMSLVTTSSRDFFNWMKKAPYLNLLAKMTSWFIGFSLLLFVYLTDMKRWKGRASCLCPWLVGAGGFMIVVGQLFWEQPLIPLGTYIGLNVVANLAMRKRLFNKTSSKLVAFGEFVSYLIVSLLLLIGWSIWAFAVDGGTSLQYYTQLADQNKGSVGQKVYVWARWGSPAIMSLCYAVLGLFAWARSRFHMKNQVSANGQLKIAPEIQACFGVLIGLFFMAWIAANMAVQDEVLSKLVLYVSICAFGGMSLYILHWIGMKRLVSLAEKNSTLQAVLVFIESDWMKGLFTLLFAPILPFILCFESIHQCIRVRLIHCGVLDREPQEQERRRLPPWICPYWDGLRQWEPASVLTKAMLAGILIFLGQVGISQALVVFLSWFNEWTESYGLAFTILLLWVVEIALFLFPPVAGIPLYVTAGIVLIPKVTRLELFASEAINFHFAVFCGNFFAFFLKMSAIALEQKAIGEPFSRSVAIKRFICVHTPFMKATRHVLSAPGFSVAKVAILVGGPDWPTSVITGILGLPLCPMLCGSVPVFFLILPCGYAAAFMPCEGCTDSEKSNSQSRSNFFLAVAAMLQGTASFLFAYFAQDVMESHADEIARNPDWCKDPQEAEVLERVAQDEKAEKEWAERTAWRRLPRWLRLLLALGSCLATTLVALLLNPVKEAFKKFSLDQKISGEPLHGNVLNIVNPLGWVCVAVSGVILMILAAFYGWASWFAPPGGREDLELAGREDQGLEMSKWGSACQGVMGCTMSGFPVDSGVTVPGASFELGKP